MIGLAMSCHVGLLLVVVNSVTAFVTDTPRQPLKVAAFNIQKFGPTKIANTATVDNIVRILERYDLVLIQEVLDSKDTVLNALQARLNMTDSWAYVTSASLGRTTYKEKYAFFYRPNLVSITGQFLYNDSLGDYFEREPFSILIEYYSVTKSAFRNVVLLGVHIRPTGAVEELSHLPEAMKAVFTHFGMADGVIAMGDFNAGCSYVSQSKLLGLEVFAAGGEFRSYIPDSADTTVSQGTSCAYDRVVSLGQVDLQDVQPYNFQTALHLTMQAAAAVSDHYPVEMKLY